MLDSISGQAKANHDNNSSLNTKTDALLAEYARNHENLNLTIEATQDQSIDEMIWDFGQFVHFLINMEAPLGIIEPPPAYEKRDPKIM